MPAKVQHTPSFPHARLESMGGGLPVEVSLIAQLGVGAGDQLFASTLARQQAHAAFVDDLDEPSTRLASTNFGQGESTALFSFSVGPQGHPFHRHAGHRVFTAVSGSGGAQLRFSTASQEQLERDPRSFAAALRYIDIPADSLFTVRFGGHTWHQFAPLVADAPHPVLFALSCHTNELGGPLDPHTRAQVLNGEAGIATLTELLPQAVLDCLQREPIDPAQVPTVALSLTAPAGSLAHRCCHYLRAGMGRLRAVAGSARVAQGFVSRRPAGRVQRMPQLPADSLLHRQLERGPVHHEDTFRLSVVSQDWTGANAAALLGELLQGFIEEPPSGVAWLMQLRNWLVQPLRLRTSHLGCPVSSLLGDAAGERFQGRFPVHAQATDPQGRQAQVVLGADDRHLRFRSCIGVHIVDQHRVDFTLGTRVQCRNAFGRFYMAAIGAVHAHYVTPAMLRAAVTYVSERHTLPDAPGRLNRAVGAT